MLELTIHQYTLVLNVLSFTMAAMAAAGVLFFVQRSEVLPRYRIVLTLLGLVTFIATYNYYRLYESWSQSFQIVDGVARSAGLPFNDAFRYADWLMTVPLLLIALVLVLDLPPRQAWLRSLVLGLQAAEMIVLGYPGQISTDVTSRWLWWGVAMVPFFIIIYQLYVSLAGAVQSQPANARGLVGSARFLTLLAWSFYPIVYILPLVGVTGTTAFLTSQIGYAIADLSAKAVYGVMIFIIAVRKSSVDVVAGSAGAMRAAKA